MDRALQIAKLGALAAIAVAALALGWAFLNLGAAANQAAEEFTVTGVEARATLRSAQDTLARARPLLDNAERASDQQRRYWFILDQRVSRTLKSTDALLRHTDESLNGERGALPQLTAAVALNGKNMADVSTMATTLLQKIGDDTEPVLVEARDAIHNIEQLAGDKDITRAAKALADASENSAKATANINAILEDLRHPEKPGKFLRALGFALSLLRGAGQTAPLFK